MHGTYQDPDGDAVTLSCVDRNRGQQCRGGPSNLEVELLDNGRAGEPGLVYVTGADPATLKGQAVFNLTVTPRPSRLSKACWTRPSRSCRAAGEPDADKLSEAIKKLQESLDPSLWIDANHVTDQDGNKSSIGEGCRQQAGRAHQEQLDSRCDARTT